MWWIVNPSMGSGVRVSGKEWWNILDISDLLRHLKIDTVLTCIHFTCLYFRSKQFFLLGITFIIKSRKALDTLVAYSLAF